MTVASQRQMQPTRVYLHSRRLSRVAHANSLLKTSASWQKSNSSPAWPCRALRRAMSDWGYWEERAQAPRCWKWRRRSLCSQVKMTSWLMSARCVRRACVCACVLSVFVCVCVCMRAASAHGGVAAEMAAHCRLCMCLYSSTRPNELFHKGYIYIYIHIYICIYIFVCVCVYACMYTFTAKYNYMYRHIYIYTHTNIFIYIYI